MKWTLLLSSLATLAAACGGSNAPAQDPARVDSQSQQAGSADPAPGPGDPPKTTSSTAPATPQAAPAATPAAPAAGAARADDTPPAAPADHATPAPPTSIINKGSSSGDTPINSGAGDAVPEHAH